MGRGPNETLHLLVLGVLDREPTHPYGVVAVLRQIHADEWAHLNPSAVYYTVEKLADGGWVRVVGTVSDDRRPDKTIYEITDSGRARLVELVQKRFMARLPMHPPLYPALINADRLSAEALEQAVAERTSMLQELVTQLESALDHYGGRFGEPVRHLLRHAAAQNRAELEWCADFLEAVRQGSLWREREKDGPAP